MNQFEALEIESVSNHIGNYNAIKSDVHKFIEII